MDKGQLTMDNEKQKRFGANLLPLIWGRIGGKPVGIAEDDVDAFDVLSDFRQFGKINGVTEAMRLEKLKG